MAKRVKILGGVNALIVTFRELINHWGHWPEEWGLMGSQDWSDEEEIRFQESENGEWTAWRQAEDGEWYVCLDQSFTADELPDVESEVEEGEDDDEQGDDEQDDEESYVGVSIDYRIGNDINFGDYGRLSYEDIVTAYASWVEQQLESAFPGATINVTTSPSTKWHYSDELTVDCEDTNHSERDIREDVRSVGGAWESQGLEGVEVPELEELRNAPYLYELPSDIVQQVIAGEDPFQPEESNDGILRVIQQFRAEPDAPLSLIAQIRKRIVEDHLDYLWEVEMASFTIGEGRVHEPMARAVLEGLDPRPIYDAWRSVQELNAKRNELRKVREQHQREMLSLRSQLRIAEGRIITDDRMIEQVTEEIARSVDAHNNKKSPQWDAYRALAAHAREAKREHDYQRILATFDALLEAGDPRVRRSGSGSPVFVAEDGSTVVHPGMGAGAGAEYCHTEWYLSQFEERGISLVDVEVVD